MRVAALILFLLGLNAVAEPAVDFIKKKDGTILKGRVVRELEQGLLFTPESGDDFVVPWDDISDAGHLDLPVFDSDRRAREDLAEQREKERRAFQKVASIEAVRAAHHGLHFGITVGAQWGTRTQSFVPDLAAVATYGFTKVLELRVSVGGLLNLPTGYDAMAGGIVFGAMSMFQVSRYITAGVGLRAGYLTNGLTTGFLGPVFQPLSVRFGKKKELELGFTAEVLFAPGPIHQASAFGILSADQCSTYASRPGGVCSSTSPGGVTLLPDFGLRLTWLAL